MFGRKETPQEYAQRKERQAREYEQRQRDYEERQRRREERQREWEQKEREFARNRADKESLVSRMRGIANQLNDTNIKQLCAERKKLWAAFKDAGYAGKEHNKKLGSDMKAASDGFQKQLEGIFQKRDIKHKQAKAAKELLVSEANRLASSSDWKGGTAKAQDMQSRWKRAGYAGKDADQALWNSFRSAIDSYFDKRKKHYDKMFQEFEKNASAKQAVIAKQSSLTSSVSASSNFKSIKSQMADLMSQWKRIGSAGKKNDALWSEFNGLRQTCFDKIKHEIDVKRRDCEFNKSRKKALIDEFQWFVKHDIQRTCNIGSCRTRVADFCKRWHAIGHACNEESSLRSEFHAIKAMANAGLDEAYEYQKQKNTSGKNSYTRGQEIAHDSWGNTTRHSRGDTGGINAPRPPNKKGKGHATNHPDGHSHKSGNMGNPDGKNFTKDGKSSKKPK